MLYEMELKDLSGHSMELYPRWLCCLLLSFFSYICFAAQLLNRKLLAWEGNITLLYAIYSLFNFLHVLISYTFYFRTTSAYITVASFLLGALCSGFAGYVGMWVSVRANVRVSSAARRSSREALQVSCH